MSRKTFIIITSSLLALLIILVGYYFITQTGGVGDEGKPTGFRSFFPFGGNEAGTSTPREVIPETPIEEVNFTQKLRKISSEPVAGAGIMDVKAGSIIRHIERATGHIYETELFSPNQNRISNTTIPLAYDAVWGNKNLSLAVRYLREDDRTIDTYSLNLKEVSTSTENVVSAVSFPVSINDISVFGSSVFYLQENPNSSAGFISSFSGAGKKQVWSSDIRELLSQYVNARTIALTTKPARDVSGFMYLVDTTSGQVKKVLSDIPGLSTLSDPDASQIIYLSQSDGVQLSVYNQTSKTYINISPSTFPEKCVWSKKNKSIVYCAVPKEFLDGTSLTSWYLGIASFGDDIWMYDLKNSTSKMIVDLYNESNEQIDVIKPIISENEQYLIFINKVDNSLWSLDLLQTAVSN